MSSAPPQPEFPQVFADHVSFVMRTLARHGVAGADADDLCQDVFLVVHRQLAGFEARSRLTTWIYGITVRVASSHRRRAHVRREIPVQAVPEQPASDDLERKMMASEGLQLLQRALASLSPAKREAFALYELEQLTMREVADAVGAPEKTVLSRIHAARREITAFVRRHERESAPPRRTARTEMQVER